MKKNIFTFIFLAVLFLSIGALVDTEVAKKNNKPGEDNQSKSKDMSMKVDCSPPNLYLDKAINKKFCGTDDCLIFFKDYWWWTNYHFQGPPNWFWNQGQAFSPRSAFVDGAGLHLIVRQDDLGGGLAWMAAEVVAVYKQNKGNLAATGYGSYLVAATITNVTWNQLDKNIAFGAFTYQVDSGFTTNNPHRELDLAEISRWGVPPCSNALSPRLCVGNAQFTLQKWNGLDSNLHRYTIKEGVRDITLVMKWNGANLPVTFSQYNGTYNLGNLPSQADNSYTSKDDQNPYVPDNGCQLFHLNLWLGNFGQGDVHPGPSNGQVQEVIVTNFQYQPL